MKLNKDKLLSVVFSLGTLAFLCGVGYFVLDSYKTTTEVVVAKPDEVREPAVDTEPVKVVPEEKPASDKLKWLAPITAQAEEREDKMNILILGVDAREDELTGRSDAMLVVSMDKKNNEMDILSIPRDSRVEIVGKGFKDKITHAYAFGGAKMAQDTVENLLNIEIDHHVVLNFTSFLSIVDTLGGIDVDVPFDFTEQDSNGKKNAMVFTKGAQTLNGEEALAYARMRKQDPKGDIGRGERQQEVVEATLNKLTSFSSIPKYTEIFSTVKNSISTDVNVLDIPSLSGYVKSFGEVNSLLLDGGGVTIGGIYYYQLNEASLNGVKSSLQE